MTGSISDFLEVFRAEADERLDHFAATLDDLQRGRGADNALDALYREMHTIKGAAGMLGLEDVRELTQAVEQLLDDLRTEAEFPPGVVSSLRRAGEAVRRHVHGSREATGPLLDELALAKRDHRARAAKVLVVEDSAPARELLHTLLASAGYRVATARDGREALAVIVGDEEIDLLVTDVEMPHLDGLDLVRAIRSHPARRTLPVVIVSERGSERDRRLGLEAGANAYIAKAAFRAGAFLAVVQSALAERE
jgi:CheY-like chemotaxis protein